jgi:hypothetical protein
VIATFISSCAINYERVSRCGTKCARPVYVHKPIIKEDEAEMSGLMAIAINLLKEATNKNEARCFACLVSGACCTIFIISVAAKIAP